MSSNGNIDIELLAGLDINSSEQEIRNAIKIIQSKIRSGDSASIQIDAKLDDRLINNTLNKLQSILKTKEISIDTRNSIIQLQKEANAMMGVVTYANKAAKEKLEFTNANKKVEKSANDTADAIRRERDAMCSLDDIDEILERINAQGRRGGNVFQQFGTTLRNAFAVYSAANLLQDALYDIIDAGKESIETVKELNDAATALRMATGGSFDSVKQLVQDYNTLGQELGAITTEVSDSADAWLRQGHSVADTNELIKDSMMLSKITSLNSADSTKYLTSAMQGYKVAVEDVVNVVSKLSAVDLESATDAAGLAEAMSRTAESARMAGVSMDRLLGMIATVGEVTQKSMSSIGEGYKTIFARMRDIKDGKMSVIGEDGEIENISNVEIALNEVGIKLRESNSEFRNFQEVLDDVAESWDNYTSVEQASIAKAFSGVRRQENFLVMMENWDKVKEYTDISANSEGVAEEKFGYYLESLEAKTNALKASLENLAAVTIDDELYGSVLDVTKSLVDATAASGLLKGALAGLATAGSIYAFQHLAGYVGDATQSFSNLSEAMNMVGSNTAASINLNRLVDLTQGLSQSQTRLVLSTTNLNDAQKIAVLRAQGLSRAEALLQLQTWGVTSAQQGATAATITFGSAMRGLYMTLAANPLFVVATAVTLGVTLWNKYKESVEDAAQTAEKAREHYQSLADELSTLNNELKTTQDRLKELEAIGTDNLSLVEQEEYDKLCKTNEELERELRIKEALAKVAARESAEASENALTDESYTSNTQTNRDGSSKKVDNITYVEELVDRATRQKELLEKTKAELLSFENNWTGDDISMVQSDEWQYLNDVVTNAEKAIGETESAISEAYETLDEDASGLVDTFGNVVDGFEDTYNRVEGVRDKVDNYFTEEPETTTKDSLEKQFGKVRVSSLSDEDIDIAVNLKNIGDMTFDELKEEINNAKKEAKEPINIKVNTSDYLSNLESLSDGFEQISAIYKDVQDMGEFDFSALAKDSDFSKTFSDAGQAYQDFIDVVAKSPTDIKACQSAFDDLVSAWFYGQEPLKNITDETYDLTVAWLKQQGVANAVEIADYALAQSKMEAFVTTHTLKEGTAEEIQALLDEAEAAGFTESSMYDLAVAVATADDSPLSFEQQINAIYDIAEAAGLAKNALDSLITAAPADPSSIDFGSWSDAVKNGTLDEWTKAKQTKNQLQRVKTAFDDWRKENKLTYTPPSINYGGGSKSNSDKKSGSSSSSKDPYVADIDKYKDLTDAVDEVETKIKHLNQVYDHTDSLAGQIAIKDKLIGLYKEEQDALTALNNARDKEIAKNVQDLRAVGFKIEYDPKSDNLKIKNREYLNKIAQDDIQKTEKLIKATEELNDANKESAEKWRELTFSIADVGKEITELRINQYEEYVRDKEHLLDLLSNRKDTIGMDLSVYDGLMKGTLRTWQYLVKDGYEKNKEQIQDIEKSWMDYYDARIKREKELLEKQLDNHDKALDGVLNMLDEQSDAIQKQIDALKSANDERREALDLQKAQAALDKARNQRTRLVLRKGQGWVWEANQDEIQSAEQDLADKRFDATISSLEKQKEALDEIKELWSEIPNIYDKEQAKLMASQLLGKNWEEKILDGRIDIYEDFKDSYFDLQEDIQDKSDELENHMNQSYINMVEIFRKMADLYGNTNNITSGKSWYVNKDGKAPSQAQVGDLVYTKGGIYRIDSKDENGKFKSTRIDATPQTIPEGMWGKEIEKANAGLTYALDKNVLSNQSIVDASNEQIEQIKRSMLTSGILNTTMLEGKEVTEEEIRALIEQTEYVGTNSLSIKGNTVQMGTLTTSIGALTKAINNTGSSIGGNGSGNITDFIEGIPVRGNTPAEQKVNYWSDVLAELKAQGASQSEIDYVEGQLEKALKKLQSSSNTPQMFANSLSETNVSAINKQIDTMYEGITGMEAVGKYLANNTYFTQEEINTLAKHMGITDINTYAMNENADSTDTNTDSQNENTNSLNNATDAIDNLSVAVTNMAYAQAEADAYNTANNMKEGVSNEKWLKYWDDVLNFSDRTGLLTQEEVNNALAQRNRYQELVNQEKAIQDMVNGVTSSTLKVELSDEDKEIIKSLQDTYNTAKAAGNEQGMELAHQLAEAVRNGFDISPSITTKPDYKLSDTTYTGGASASTGNKSNLQKEYERILNKGGWSEDYTKRLETAIAIEKWGSGMQIDTYTDEYGRTSTIINAADKSELNMSADDLKNRYDAGWRPVNDGMDKLGGNLKETNDTLSDNSDAMYDSSDKIDGSADKIVDSSNNVVGKLDSLENAISNANFGNGYADNRDTGGGSHGGGGDPTKGMSAEDKARYNNLKTTAAIAERNGNTAIKNAAKSQMADIKDKYTKKKAKGGHNLEGGIYNVNEKGDEIVLDKPDEGNWIRINTGGSVIPHEVSAKLWEFGANPKMFLSDVLGYDAMKMNQQMVYVGGNGGGTTVNEHHYHVGNVELSGVKDVIGFMEGIRTLPNRASQYMSNSYNRK